MKKRLKQMKKELASKKTFSQRDHVTHLDLEVADKDLWGQDSTATNTLRHSDLAEKISNIRPLNQWTVALVPKRSTRRAKQVHSKQSTQYKGLKATPVVHPAGSYNPSKRDYDEGKAMKQAVLEARRAEAQKLTFVPSKVAIPQEDSDSESEHESEEEPKPRVLAKKLSKTKRNKLARHKALMLAQKQAKEARRRARAHKNIDAMTQQLANSTKKRVVEKMKEEKKLELKYLTQEPQPMINGRVATTYGLNKDILSLDKMTDNMRSMPGVKSLLKERFRGMHARNLMDVGRNAVRQNHDKKKRKMKHPKFDLEEHAVKHFVRGSR